MKNKLRKMLSLVLSVVIAMSAISLNTFATTIMNIVNGSNQKLYVDWYDYSYNFNGRLNTSTYGQIIKLNVGSPTGQVAYCIQSSKDAWTSDYTAQKTYNLLSLTQQQNLKHALIYGYQGTTKYGYNADTERIATSIVTWNICDGWFNNSSESTAVGIFTEDMSSSMATNVKACYNKIKEQMLSHLTIPSYAVKPTVTNVPKQKMTTNSDGTFTITLTDSKNVSKYYDWQTAIKKYSYLSIITDTEGKLVIKSTKPIPSSSAITLTAERIEDDYQNYEKIKAAIEKYQLAIDMTQTLDSLYSQLYSRAYNTINFTSNCSKDQILLQMTAVYAYKDKDELARSGYYVSEADKPNVFISYSHNDKIIVKDVKDRIVMCGLNVWFDENCIAVGKHIVNEFMDGITKSDYAIIFASKSTVSSVYSKAEIQNLFVKVLNNEIKLFIVKLDDVDMNSIFPNLKNYKYYDFYQEHNIDKLVMSIVDFVKKK